MKSTSDSLWRWSLHSVTGPSHASEGGTCQDMCGITSIAGHNDILILALSDGAGSARFAKEGAEVVVEAWLSHFSEVLSAATNPVAEVRQLTAITIEPVLEKVRERVRARAQERGVGSVEFSATMLGAIVTPEGSFVAQVGDGCWVGLVDGVLGALTWPVNGEFYAQTLFAISDLAEDALQCVHIPRGLRGLVGFTDGIERIALHLGARIPEPLFFHPLFELVRSPEGAGNEIVQFLNSDRVRAESDDDKTLAILVRDDGALR